LCINGVGLESSDCSPALVLVDFCCYSEKRSFKKEASMFSAFTCVLRMVGLLAIIWTFGLAFGLIALLLILCGGLRVKGWWRLVKPRRTGVLIAATHPSVWEPIILAALYAPIYLVMPWRTPWSTPDAGNFTNRWYWRWLKLRAVPIPRGHGRALLLATCQIKALLAQGGTVILFPGGGREARGKEFVHSAGGVSIRRLRTAGLGRVVDENTLVIPVFVARELDRREQIHGRPDRWHHMTIIVGDPIQFAPGTTPETMARVVEYRLMELADTNSVR
jgi:1-acyl-sn-glycerol-3-phosphate acyltransferase